MQQFDRRLVGTVFFLLCAPALAGAPSRFTLATMPRVDVHAHIPDKWDVIDQYMGLRDAIKKELDVEMAMWISVGGSAPPDLKELNRMRGAGRNT